MGFKKTKALIEKLVEVPIVPGVDYTIIQHGEMIENQTLGMRAWAPHSCALKPGTYFDLASLTKVIGTVPLILKLEQIGQLQLDDPVSRYLPQITDQRVTLRHLITHTSGATAWIENRDALNASELREAIYQTLTFEADFNQKVVYNDYNYLLLGFIIERILHVPVQVAIQNEILEPLGLTQTTFNPNPQLTVPTERRQGIIMQGQVHDPKANSLGQHAGSAGLFATKADVVKFTMKMMANENELFNAEMMHRFQVNQTANPQLQRSLGWAFLKQNQQQVLLRHSGFTGTFILFDPLTQNGLVLLSNRVHPEPNLEFLDYRQRIYQTFAEEDF
jgi:CubicO group peptidase (beta-lactamase class C family)